jgi:hypothetical protein
MSQIGGVVAGCVTEVVEGALQKISRSARGRERAGTGTKTEQQGRGSDGTMVQMLVGGPEAKQQDGWGG